MLRFASKGRQGFTLVELLVVIAIIGVLVALLLPALSSARAAANASGSASNMSSFGRGFELYATNNNGAYSSGAFDHLRDGDSRQYGWVADLILSKVAQPGKSLDAGSRNKINEKVADYTLAGTQTGNITGAGVASGRWPAGSAHDSTTCGEAYFGGDSAAKEFWDAGNNSNYATTWHFSRGDPIASDNTSGLKGLADGDGPLTTNHLNQGLTTAARVALMGPARAGDGGDANVVAGGRAAAKAGAGADVINDFIGAKLVKVGDLLVESYCDGMNVVISDSAICPITSGSSVRINEYNDIEPLHQPKNSDGSGGFAPLLFADLHVEKVYDTVNNDTGAAVKTGDNYIGNGVSRNANGNITAVSCNTAAAYNEISDAVWVKRLRNRQSASGSVVE